MPRHRDIPHPHPFTRTTTATTTTTTSPTTTNGMGLWVDDRKRYGGSKLPTIDDGGGRLLSARKGVCSQGSVG